MAPGSVTAANLVGHEPQVRVEETSATASGAMTIPTVSVGVYAFPVN